MNAFTESFEKLTSFGTEGFEPVREAAGVAVESMEKLARTNYAMVGDVLEFAVESARMPLETSEMSELFEKQMSAVKAFSETLTGRINEYTDLGKDLQSQFANYVNAEAATANGKA